MNKRGVLFDLDGVLLDSEGTYTEFWGEIDRRYPTGVPGFCQIIKGCNLHEILTTYFPGAELQRQVEESLNEFQRDMEYRFFDGAMAFVEQLEAAGIPCCVVTSSDERKMQALYRQYPDFRAHFAAVVTGDMVVHAKPEPECFLLGAKMLQRDITQCYVLEDSLNGLRAAQASGAHVIALATTLPRHEVEPYAHLVIDCITGFTVEQMLQVS